MKEKEGLLTPPLWTTPPPEICLTSIHLYEHLALSIEHLVQQLLTDYHYDTIGNFIRFYEAYRKSGEWDLWRFYLAYFSKIVKGEYNCVGLGLELLSQMTELDQSIGCRFYMVSCEEGVEDTGACINQGLDQTWEIEHALVCAKVTIGGRPGVILLDPGYHVARLITVMKDSVYPHTGWFTQTNEPCVKREFRYFFPDNTMDFVIWEVKETRGLKVKITQNIIYVAQPYGNPVEKTEKRNLVYDFKNWVVRNVKGEITAGLYFAITDRSPDLFTIMCTDANSNKQRLKLSFRDLLEDKEFIPEELEIIQMCGQQLGVPTSFPDILHHVAEILADSNFVLQLLEINNHIISLTS